MDLRENVCEVMDWIQLASVNTDVNLNEVALSAVRLPTFQTRFSWVGLVSYPIVGGLDNKRHAVSSYCCATNVFSMFRLRSGLLDDRNIVKTLLGVQCDVTE